MTNISRIVNRSSLKFVERRLPSIQENIRRQEYTKLGSTPSTGGRSERMRTMVP